MFDEGNQGRGQEAKMDGLALLSGAKWWRGGVRTDLSSHPTWLIQFLAFLPLPPPTHSQPTVIKLLQQGFTV